MPRLYTLDNSNTTVSEYISALQRLAQRARNGSLTQDVESVPLFNNRPDYRNDLERQRYKFALLYIYLFTTHRPLMTRLLKCYFQTRGRQRQAAIFNAQTEGEYIHHQSIKLYAAYPFFKLIEINRQHAAHQKNRIENKILTQIAQIQSDRTLQAQLYELLHQQQTITLGDNSQLFNVSLQHDDHVTIQELQKLFESHRRLSISERFYHNLRDRLCGNSGVRQVLQKMLRDKAQKTGSQRQQAIAVRNQMNRYNLALTPCFILSSYSAFATLPLALTPTAAAYASLLKLTTSLYFICSLLTEFNELRDTSQLNNSTQNQFKITTSSALFGFGYLILGSILPAEGAVNSLNNVKWLIGSSVLFQLICHNMREANIDYYHQITYKLNQYNDMLGVMNQAYPVSNDSNAHEALNSLSLFRFEPSTEEELNNDQDKLAQIAELG